MKNNFIEISKVYNFVETITTQYIFMSNIKYYKNITPKTSSYDVDKFEQNFELEKKSRQSYKNKKNIEGYKLKILVSDELLLPENRLKLRKYINKSIEYIAGYSKVNRLKYVVSKYTSVGKSKYINVYFIDRVIYEKPLVTSTTKKVWVNKNTGKRVSKTYKNAIRVNQIKSVTKYFSSKLRFKLIHQNDRKLFISMMETIESLLKEYELIVFQNEQAYIFERQYVKKKICKNGNYYYMNDYDNQYKGIINVFKLRAIKVYNTFVNSFELARIDVTRLDVDRLMYDIEEYSTKYCKKIARYEQAMLNMIDLVVNNDIYEIYPNIQNS